MKNIRNNLPNGKKFVFPEFIYNYGLRININCTVGYIQWKDLYKMYDLDKDLKGCLGNWTEQWCDSPAFKLTAQTKSALVTTLCAQAILIDELLVDGYQFVKAARLQSDAIERRFTQYSQMSGRKFLVSLKEVINSERILKC